jgi:hypothetical protein
MRRAFGEFLEVTFSLALHPRVQALAARTEIRGHFGDGEFITSDAQDSAVTLFHFA